LLGAARYDRKLREQGVTTRELVNIPIDTFCNDRQHVFDNRAFAPMATHLRFVVA